MSTAQFDSDSGLRLITTVEGDLKVLIDSVALFTANGTAHPNVKTSAITSIALFASQTTGDFKTYSNTLNDEQCVTELLVSGSQVTSLVKEIRLLKLDFPFEYEVTIIFTYLDGTTIKTIEENVDAFKVLGDILPPTINFISQSEDNTGTSLVLNISPCSTDADVSQLLLDEIASITILVNGELQAPVVFDATHMADGNFTIEHAGEVLVAGSGSTPTTYKPLVTGQEYTFAAFITTKGGAMSDASVAVKGTPLLTPNAIVTGEFAINGDGENGNYVISYDEITRAVPGSTLATSAKKLHALTTLQIFAYEHPLDEEVATTKDVSFSKFRPIGLPIKATVNSDYYSFFPAGSVVVSGNFGGRYARAILVVSNGHGPAPRSVQNGHRVELEFAVPSIVATRGVEVGEWELTIKAPTASYQGYMIGSYNVEVKASDEEWDAISFTDIAGEFTAIDEEEEYLVEDVTGGRTASAHVMAVESLTPGKTGKLGSAKQFSEVKLLFTATSALNENIQFGVRAAYIPTIDVDFPTAVVEASDLSLDEGELMNGVDSVADAPVDADYSEYADSAVFKKVAVATWTAGVAATYSDDTPNREGYARYELEIDELVYPVDGTDLDVKYYVYVYEEGGESNEFTLDHIITGTMVDFDTIRTNIDVKRGRNTSVRVMASASDEDSTVVAETAYSTAQVLRPSGVGAFGSDIRVHSKQGPIAYDTTSPLSLLFNRTDYAGGFTVNKCELRIAIDSDTTMTEETGLFNIDDDKWERAYKFYKVTKDVYGVETVSTTAETVTKSTVAGTKTTGTEDEEWLLFKISNLAAGKSVKYELSADWQTTLRTGDSVDEWEADERITLEATPLIPVLAPLMTLQPGNSVVQVTCLPDSSKTEYNTDFEEINKTLKNVAVSTKGKNKTELGSSSSASFPVTVVNGVSNSITVKARYANVNYGNHGDDEEYIESGDSASDVVTAGSSLDKVTNFKAVAGSETAIVNDSAVTTFGCNLKWDLAAGREVDIYALFDQEGASDMRYKVAGPLTTKKLFVSNDDLLEDLKIGSTYLTESQLFEDGVTFSIVQRTIGSAATTSAPSSAFYDAVARPDLVASDFSVTSCAESLLIEFSGTDAAITKCAGHSTLAAKILCTDLSTLNITTTTVSDILTVNGVLIPDLNDKRKYSVECVIYDASGNFDDLSLTLSASISPAPAPKAVTKLKATAGGADLEVSFVPSKDNGEYTIESYYVYITTDIGGATKYVKYTAGALGAAGTLSYQKEEYAWATLLSTATGVTLEHLRENTEYTITVESVFNGDNEDETAPSVSASTTGRLGDEPVIENLRVDTRNKLMSAVVNCKGSSLLGAHLFVQGDTSEYIQLDISSIANKDGYVAIQADLPEGTEKLALMVHNAIGMDMHAAPSEHMGVDTITATSPAFEYKESTHSKWKFLPAK